MALVRRARREDIPRMESLIIGEGMPAYALDEYVETFFALEDDGELMGCAGLELYGEAAILRSVVVAPERRGRAEGRLLVQAALQEARERGVRRAYLFTMSASPFFRRLGFREIEPEEFEEAVRASRQYQAVSTIPELRERLQGMVLEL